MRVWAINNQPHPRCCRSRQPSSATHSRIRLPKCQAYLNYIVPKGQNADCALTRPHQGLTRIRANTWDRRRDLNDIKVGWACKAYKESTNTKLGGDLLLRI
jgi:hypothetical protein